MRSLVALATCCALVVSLPAARAHTKSPRAHADSPVVVAAAKDGIDTRTQMYLAIAKRLAAGERAAAMQGVLEPLAQETVLEDLLPRVNVALLPETHRPVATEDGQITALPAMLENAILAVENELDPGPYRLQEFYWRGYLRLHRYQYDDGIRDLVHYAERLSLHDTRAQIGLLRVGEVYLRSYPNAPDPRGIAILDRLRLHESAADHIRISAASAIAIHHFRLGEYVPAAAIFEWLAATYPDHILRDKAQLLAGQSHIKNKDYPEAIRVLQDLADQAHLQADRDVQAEARFWLGNAYRNNGAPRRAYITFKCLTWDYPNTKWAKMARRILTEEADMLQEHKQETEQDP